MIDPDDALLTEAVRLADASARAGGAPFAALLVRAETVLGTGVNTVRRDRDPTAHAEVVALRRACRRLRATRLPGATLVASAEPCALCLVAAAFAGVERVIFAADAASAARFGFEYGSARAVLEPGVHRPSRVEHVTVPGASDPFTHALRQLQRADPR